ncbi:MAG: hypothetical protein O2783_03955, partial [Chloroflexi bacterium]|nr:hypothetical protein [Chloroflexota bacterium]
YTRSSFTPISRVPKCPISADTLHSEGLPSSCQTLHEASHDPIVVVSREPLSETVAAACFDAGAGARLLRSTSPILLLSWARALTRRF